MHIIISILTTKRVGRAGTAVLTPEKEKSWTLTLYHLQELIQNESQT